jgi:hypothetical protein
MSRMPERRPSIQVSDLLTGPPPAEPGCRILTLPVEPAAQFDTMETSFFKAGDELSALPAALDCLEDQTGLHAPRRRAGKHTFWLASVAATLAVCATVILWNMHHDARASVVSPPVTENARPASATAPAAAPAVTTAPAPATVPAIPLPTPVAAPSTPTARPAAAGVVPSRPDDNAIDACKRAYDRRRAKEILDTCARAFASEPGSAEVAVMLAKTEFDRGHARQALDWAKKAVALDESRADAYVFLGGAEQAAGHTAAAKTAYRRYLQLAPQGRYAADLRAVLGSF